MQGRIWGYVKLYELHGNEGDPNIGFMQLDLPEEVWGTLKPYTAKGKTKEEDCVGIIGIRQDGFQKIGD